MKKIIILTLLPFISYSQIDKILPIFSSPQLEKIVYSQTQDINYAKNIKNNTTVESYETKDKHIIKVGDTITIGTAYNKKGRNILGDLWKFKEN